MNIEQDAERRSEANLYKIGLLLAIVLSAVPFGAVSVGLLPKVSLFWVIGLCALIQVVVHFRCFLHIDLASSHRDDLQLILFSACIVILMVGGTLWVINNQRVMMGM